MKFCSNCGVAVQGAPRFCSECGFAVGAETVAPPTEHDEHAPETPVLDEVGRAEHSVKRQMYCLLAGSLLILGIGWSVTIVSSSGSSADGSTVSGSSSYTSRSGSGQCLEWKTNYRQQYVTPPAASTNEADRFARRHEWSLGADPDWPDLYPQGLRSPA